MTAQHAVARTSKLTWTALAIAVLGLAGSLWLSLSKGYIVCPLCLYQRSFLMSVVAVLAMGLLIRGRSPGSVSLPALPLAVAGGGVANYHTYLEIMGRLECPAGLLGLSSAPLQALLLYLVLILVLVSDIVRSRKSGGQIRTAAMWGVLAGCGLAAVAVASAPPRADAPSEPYPSPPEGCRPAYQGP